MRDLRRIEEVSDRFVGDFDVKNKENWGDIEFYDQNDEKWWACYWQ